MEFMFLMGMLSIGVVLCILSYLIKDSLLMFGGTTIIFILGLSLFVSGLEYPTGEDEDIKYIYGNCFDNMTAGHWFGCGDTAPSQADREAFLFYTESETTINYETKNDMYTRGIGLILIYISFYLYFTLWDIYKKSNY